MVEGKWRIYALVHYLTLSELMLANCQLYTHQWNCNRNFNFSLKKINLSSANVPAIAFSLNMLEILVTSCYSFIRQGRFTDSGPCCTKRRDVLPQYLVKTRSREIIVYIFSIAFQTFDRHLGSCAAEMAVKFQSDTNIITPNRAAARLHKIWW